MLLGLLVVIAMAFTMAVLNWFEANQAKKESEKSASAALVSDSIANVNFLQAEKARMDIQDALTELKVSDSLKNRALINENKPTRYWNCNRIQRIWP